jgi:hypothetical protein
MMDKRIRLHQWGVPLFPKSREKGLASPLLPINPPVISRYSPVTPLAAPRCSSLILFAPHEDGVTRSMPSQAQMPMRRRGRGTRLLYMPRTAVVRRLSRPSSLTSRI